jgi:hypothetical protein
MLGPVTLIQGPSLVSIYTVLSTDTHLGSLLTHSMKRSRKVFFFAEQVCGASTTRSCPRCRPDNFRRSSPPPCGCGRPCAAQRSWEGRIRSMPRSLGLLGACHRLGALNTFLEWSTLGTPTAMETTGTAPFNDATDADTTHTHPPTYPTRTQPHAASHSMSPAMHALHSHLSDPSAQHGAVFEPHRSLTAGASEQATGPALLPSSSPRPTRVMGTSCQHHRPQDHAQLAQKRATQGHKDEWKGVVEP